MEQQQENHMRLPPPVTNTIGFDSTLLHQSSHHQHMPAGPQTKPRSILSPPLASSAFYGAVSPHPHYQQVRSSASPRPLSAVPGHSPPSYAYSQQHGYDHDHDPSTLNFPTVPSTELAPLQLNAQEHNVYFLPSLAFLTGPPSASSDRFGRSSARSDTSYSPPPRPRGWPSGNPYSAYYTAGHGQSADSPARMDIDSMSNGTRGPLSPDTFGGGPSSVSLDDPDVKMAAEALGDLKSNFVSSPRNRTTNLPSPPNHFGTPGPTEAEPLLSLVMTSGSLLAKPIEGTVSAYTTTKNRTPGFIKAPVEYVEGVVGSGLHLSGIEGGVRWFFRGKGRQHSSGDVESGEGSAKRRRFNSTGRTSAPRRAPDVAPLTSTITGEADPYGFATTEQDRRLSMSTVDTLPAYDDARSPAYTESALSTPEEKDGQVTPTRARPSSTTPTAWQSRLIMSTSGLSIAMSEESLRSLKYCLSWLRWANEHISRVIGALKESLDNYDNNRGDIYLSEEHAMNDEPRENPEQERRELRARIGALRSEILKTLQGAIETVSKYAGGALPDNARALVRRHLTSLPQRFRLATLESNVGSPAPSQEAGSSSTEAGQEKEVREGAQRMLVLAKEGLDMMAQVSGVLDGTIVSAEEWCDRLGRRRRDGQGEEEEEEEEEEEHQEEGEHQKKQLQSSHEPQTVPFAGVGVEDDADEDDDDVKMS